MEDKFKLILDDDEKIVAVCVLAVWVAQLTVKVAHLTLVISQILMRTTRRLKNILRM